MSINQNESMGLPTPSLLSDIARSTAFTVARDVFGVHLLYEAQPNVLERLCLMHFKNLQINPSSILFIQPTGGRKSLVRYVYSAIFRGVSLTIVPILSIGADQKEKINIKAVQTVGRIISIQIDKISDMMIIKGIIELPGDTTKMILLFTSP